MTMRHPMDIYSESLKTAQDKTASVVGPYGHVGTRAVTFWTLFPITGKNGQTYAVIKGIQEADKALEAEFKKSRRSSLPSARDLGNSVQMGHIVQPDKSGNSLVVYTQFWKEGNDRTTSDIYEMQEFLKGSGTKLSPPPIRLDG